MREKTSLSLSNMEGLEDVRGEEDMVCFPDGIQEMRTRKLSWLMQRFGRVGKVFTTAEGTGQG